MQTKIRPATRAAEGEMNAQPTSTGMRCTARAVRFLLWLFAAFAFADFAPAVADPLRAVKSGLTREAADTRPLFAPEATQAVAIVATDCDPLSELELPKPDPVVDADDGIPATHLLAPGATALGAEALGGGRLDGQPFAAFHSRAPPSAA